MKKKLGESSKSSSSEVSFKSQGTNTTLCSVMEKPLVKFDASTSSNFISVGQTYSGDATKGVITAGKRKYVVEIPIRQSDECSRQELWRRAADGITLLNFVSAPDGQQNDDKLKDVLVKTWLRHG